MYIHTSTARKRVIFYMVVSFLISSVLWFVVYNIATKSYRSEINALNTKIIYYKQIEDKFFKLKSEEIVNKKVDIDKLRKEKEELIIQNGKLENTIKKLSSVGVKPKNYILPPTISRGSYSINKDKMKYVGNWLGTFYAPNKQECSNNKGITASGKLVIPGKTIAVDPRYWKLGTKFYIEGFGEVVATDTGSDIKGRERFDFCVFSTHISDSGSFRARVWIINE